ncbi:MerR family transcriptional regulator [Paenibacillus sinopodophylli]|uniref:MerR family transcriptional regulator n=1 Tax=Paenibacillus sinopodophylli TaxID=1837342 RepID=UPI00110CBC01|nr:MerR family transcriptional regulator [Paenibacillus sinopodophylli]
MEYTIQKLGLLAGISTRTLRYYDEIGMLKPSRINSSGYRIYGNAEVDRLQQILFYKELGVGLEGIKAIVTSPAFDGASALQEHRKRLIEKREQLDLLIANVDKTLAQNEGRITMTNKEKFDGFKQQLIDTNEQKYGEEIRQKYGNTQIERSNQMVKNMTEEQHTKVEQLNAEVLSLLETTYPTGDPAGELAQKMADLHRQWITFYWGSYSKEAHAGVAQMYVNDERFTAYYEKHQPGGAAFLRDAILIYTGMEQS